MQTPAYRVIRLEDNRLAIFDSFSSEPLLQRFSAKTRSLETVFGRSLPLILEDLIDVAVTAYVTDRAIRRQRPPGEKGSLLWSRDFELHIPVTEPARWNQAEVRGLLSDALEFLTEDRWSFRFLQREGRPVQQVLFPPTPPIRVSLFSGGLDSLAGLVLDLEKREEGQICAVTCATSSRLLHKQKQILRGLQRGASDRLIPVILPVKLVQSSQGYNSNENTQRARGFLFCILGAVAALMGGVDELSIYENGVGAINLPLSDAQLGAQSSRAANPVAFQKIERFLSVLLGRKFSLTLPYLFATKGQMCRRLNISTSRELALQTVSCDSFPMRSSGADQCGFCTSCLLRRQALWTAGFHEDLQKGLYRRDVFAGESLLGNKNLAPWWDMLSQVERFGNALCSQASWTNLIIEFPELAEVAEILGDTPNFAAGATVRQRLLRLYQDYCREWHTLPAYPKGWKFSAPELRLSA
jgi:7-cyano-7-deazaguanine synthase in queuosine biosynthesis